MLKENAEVLIEIQNLKKYFEVKSSRLFGEKNMYRRSTM